MNARPDESLDRSEAEAPPEERKAPLLHVAWSSDRAPAAQPPVVDLEEGSCAWVAALPEGVNPGQIHLLMRQHLRTPPTTAQQLRLVLLKVMREVHPRPESLAAVLTMSDGALAAATPGASVVLVRETRVLDRAVDASTFATQEHDRVALLCNKLDALLGDADELGRIVGADDPHSTAVTLVEVGHLRGGGSDLCAVVAVVGGEELDDVTEDTGSFAVDDLLSALAPTLDDLQRKATPPRPSPRQGTAAKRRRLGKKRQVVPQAASMGQPMEQSEARPFSAAVPDQVVTDAEPDGEVAPGFAESAEPSEEGDLSQSGPISASLSGPILAVVPSAHVAPRPPAPPPLTGVVVVTSAVVTASVVALAVVSALVVVLLGWMM